MRDAENPAKKAENAKMPKKFKVHLLNSEGEVKFTSRHKEDVLRWHYCDE